MKRLTYVLLLVLTVGVPAGAAEPPSNLTAEQRAQLYEAERLTNKAGQLFYGQGKAREAILIAQQALAIRKEVLGEKHPETARSLNNLGVLLREMGDYAAARPYLEQALVIHKEVLGQKHSDTAISFGNLGYLLQAMGDYEAARPYYERALAIHKEVLGLKHPVTATSLNNLGTLLQAMGDYEAARPYYERVLAVNKVVLGWKHRDTATALNNLGTLLQAMGDCAAARPYYEQALAIDKEVLGEKHPGYATDLNNLGFLLRAMGDRAAARPYYEQALAIHKEVLGKKHPRTAMSFNSLGVLLTAMGDYAAARLYLEQALAIQKEILGEKHPVTATSLNNLGTLLQAMGDHAAARPYYEQTLAIYKEVLGEKHPDTARSLNNLGSLLKAMGDYAAARPYYEQALAICKEVLGEKHPDTALVFGNLSTLEAASGRWEEAAANEDQARRIVRRHFARVLPSLSAKEQAGFMAANDKRMLHGALSLGLVRAVDPRLVSMSAAWLLNGKAVAQEALAQRALFARQSDDPKVGVTVKELLALRRQLAALTLSAPKPGQEAAHRARLEQMERHEVTLARRIDQAKGETYEADPWVEVAAVRRALRADAILVDIARFKVYKFQAKGEEERWQPARYVAWIIPAADREQAVEIIDLGKADKIDQAVQEVRKALQAAMGKKGTINQQGEPEAEKLLQEPLEQLAKLVLEPIVNQLGDARQLILSPDAALWLVPWGALPLSDGRYAIEQFQIRYVVSGRDLATRQTARLQTNRPVIMANPDYDLSPTETQAATRAVLRGREVPGSDQLRSPGPMTSSSALPKFARLPYTAVEAQLISPKLQSYADEAPVLYTDQYALEGVFKAFKRPRVAVLSTHGFFLEDQEVKQNDRMLASTEIRGVALTVDGKPIENPLLRCGLLLAGCNRSGEARAAGAEDGVLTGMEIVVTDLRGTELVVLSACETGLGQVRNGEGVAGLRQAFQLAGAQAVVATLWQVSDRESARLMTAFFDNLAAGQTKADALRNAQLKMIEYRRNKYAAAHPFFWAAFTITGE